MSSIIKSISLDPKTAAIAKRVPNFSKFVRQCLLQWEAIKRSPECPVERLEHPLVGNHCVPAPTRICLKHWPLGTPLMADWREFRHMIEFDSFHTDRDRLLKAWPFLEPFNAPEEWIQHRAELVNDPGIDFENMDIEGNAKPKSVSKRQHKSRMKRLMAFLRAKKAGNDPKLWG